MKKFEKEKISKLKKFKKEKNCNEEDEEYK